MATPYTGDTRMVRAHTPAQRYALLAQAAEQIEQEENTRTLVYTLLLGAAAIGAYGVITFHFYTMAGALLLVAIAVPIMLLSGEG